MPVVAQLTDNFGALISDSNPLPVSVSGGGGSGQVEVTNWPTTQAVSGPLTNAQQTAITGAASAAAYTDVTGAASGTMIALLKGIFVQLAEINAKTPAP